MTRLAPSACQRRRSSTRLVCCRAICRSTLRINSPGGSVFDAVAIHNALSRHAGPVTVWIDGIAASAASYIAMAGDEIVMPENTFLMIHDPAGVVMGTAADMRNMAGTLDKIADSMLRGYAARSGRPEDEIAAADGRRDLVRRGRGAGGGARHAHGRARPHRGQLRYCALSECTAGVG